MNTRQDLAGRPVHAPPCRLCGTLLERTLVDLGPQPLCESYVRQEDANEMEPFYPLHVRVCDRCFLVQLEEFVAPEDIFTEYAYFSSFSDSWVEHARCYAKAMIAELGLGPDGLVVELASNDGYLLKHFVAQGIPVLGVEPAANVAKVAVDIGVPTRVAFFGQAEAERMRSEGLRANLIAANNVLAQVPDLNDFVAGIATLLAPGGTVTIEFPHLQRLIEENQFDTIYHEHFSYFSFVTTQRALAKHGLRVVDVEEIATHGGSLRVHAAHDNDSRGSTAAVVELAARERSLGYETSAPYEAFGIAVARTKRQLLSFLISAKDEGRSIVGYGAPGKGNTLLNYCGIRTDLLDYVVDRNPYKQGRLLPGTRIPIHAPERIDETKPDDILILPWNLRHEIAEQLAPTSAWGARLFVPIPEVEVVS